MKYFPFQSQPLNTDKSLRTRSPTVLVEGRSNMPARTAAKRQHETMQTVSAIYGGSKNNPNPALGGMFDTLVKSCKVDKIKDYVLNQNQVTEKVFSAVFKENLKAFESSPVNVKRSIAVFYSSGVMDKRNINL